MSACLKLCIIGHGGSGKSHSSAWLARHTRLRYWGSTSRVIAPHAAARLGIPEAAAYAARHEHRELWREIGDELRRGDPGHLARRTLDAGDICEGVRSRGEMLTIVREGLAGVILWIKRDVPPDPTLEFDPLEFADCVIPNDGPAWQLETRLRRLSAALGILRTS